MLEFFEVEGPSKQRKCDILPDSLANSSVETDELKDPLPVIHKSILPPSVACFKIDRHGRILKQDHKESSQKVEIEYENVADHNLLLSDRHSPVVVRSESRVEQSHFLFETYETPKLTDIDDIEISHTPIIIESKKPAKPSTKQNCEIIHDTSFKKIQDEIDCIIKEKLEKAKQEKLRLEKIEREKLKLQQESERKKKEAEEAEKKKKEEEKQAKQAAQVQAKPVTASGDLAAAGRVSSSGAKKGDEKVVIPDPWAEEFVARIKKSKELIDAAEPIRHDATLKDMRSNTMKFVTRAMNLCSSNTKSIRDASQELLQGILKIPQDPSDKEFIFTVNYLAKQFVDQSETQIERNPKSAWSFGSLLQILRENVNEIYNLIIGVILLDTPSAIPIFHQKAMQSGNWIGAHPPKRAELTAKETIRILSICKLYWASLVQGQDADSLWKIWSRILQCDLPIALIMAPSLIDISGSFMMTCYPTQGPKLVYYLRTKSLKTWHALSVGKNATSQEKLQYTKLEIILEHNTKTGSFAAPEGQEMSSSETSGLR